MKETQIGILSGPYRMLTIGIILIVASVGFEGLAMTTIAPKLAEDLNGFSLYGWIFSAFLLSQIVGTMVIGNQIDKSGVFQSYLTSIIVFVIGIVIAATSINMYMLISARGLQGLGAGGLLTCVYYSITLNYPNELRTKILAAFSSAFILPALIGPYIAGLLAENFSWRFVFWVILPFFIIAVSLTLPTFRKLQTKDKTNKNKTNNHKERDAIILTIGTGLLLAGLGLITEWKGIIFSIIGLSMMILPLKNLLPKGSFTLEKGLPATIISRGFFVASFFAVESYIVLALTTLKGLPADKAGLIVAAGSISWSTAAWVQSKLDEKDHATGRKKRVTTGISLMLLGVILIITVIILPGSNTIFAILSQIVTGFGIGLAHPTTGAIALQHANKDDAGNVSATIQFIDSFSPGLSIGIGGALIGISASLGLDVFTGILLALSLQLLLLIFSFIISFRITTN